VLGVLASARLPALLSNTFAVPGTDSDRARVILDRGFGERPDGTFTVVFRAPRATPALRARLAGAARVVPTGHASALRSTAGIVFGEVDTTLDLQHAKGYTAPLRRALRGDPAALVTGPPAIQHDLEPILSADLRRGEAIAVPVALIVLLAVFGFSLAILVPFAFAACTITATIAAVYAIAHGLTMVSYVTNLVELIGLGLAVDYSLLVVYRFREELAREDATVDDAIVNTMATAGRAVVFSGATVAIGLALLVFVPVPFIRSLGVGGFLVPLASLAAAVTLQPALLSLLGRRGAGRAPVAAWIRAHVALKLPSLPGTIDVDRGFWARLARAIMRRPRSFLAVGAAVLVAAAVPAVFLHVTPGSFSALPHGPESVAGLTLLRERAGAGTMTPTEVVVDARSAGRARTPAVRAAIKRLADGIFHDHETLIVASGTRAPYVDASGRYARVFAAGRHEYGAAQTQAFVHRLRRSLVPAARFPAGVGVYAGGAPAQGVDYLSRSYGWFPWLALGALVLTYLVLLRAFRSVVLPLKAVLLNLLSVAAVYGLLVIVFQWGVGADALGLHHVPEVEGWIPIFLFAMLFGLSMDYEVFLVTRMRESWDHVHDNARAVSHGLERTGRIVTAAAVIMVAAFSGFVAGRVAGLQEFGAGLALAVLIDATVVRAILVPALMAILDRWNWWLPGRIARLVGAEE
jgi:RND superfamily putative drug exporter